MEPATPPHDPRTLDRLRPVRARIDLDRLAANYRAVAAAVPVPLMPVVKADAYGHGAATIGRALERLGAPMLAVAFVEEGIALRRAGVRVPVVILAGFGRGQAPALVEHGLTPVVSTPATAEAVLDAARGRPRPLPVHVKVDTGMGRLGFTPEAFLETAARLADSGGVVVEGAMTHFARADDHPDTTARQLDLFERALDALESRGLRPPWVHACNSAGLASWRPRHTLVRPGLLLYGVRPRPLSPDLAVRPVMQVSAEVALVKELPVGAPVSYGARWVAARPSRIATIPLGYADGVPRTDGMRERGRWVIGGQSAPVAGTVCMDLTMADVTDLGAVQEGHEAVLFGDEPDAWELAERAGTNAYEVLTSIGSRVPRVFVEDGRLVGVESRYGG